MDGVRKEIACIRNEDDNAAFSLRETSNMSKLEEERSQHSHDEADEQAAKEDKQENAHGLDSAERSQLRGIGVSVFLCGLEQHNGNCIVENRFAEDDSVELWIDPVRCEDGQDCYGIGG